MKRFPIAAAFLAGMLLAHLAFLLACGQASGPQASILFPADGASAREGSPILLIADSAGEWISSLDGTLGYGRSIYTLLSPGNHMIELFPPVGSADTIRISIFPASYLPGTQDRIQISQHGATGLFAPGRYAPVLISCSDSGVDIEISLPAIDEEPGAKASSISTGARVDDPIRDIRLNFLESFQNQKTAGETRPAMALAKNVKPPPEIGTLRMFHLADPSKGTGEPGFNVEAELVLSETGWRIWLDRASITDPADTDALFDILTRIIGPRLTTLFGEAPDPDEDGGISILMTGILNQAHDVVGFFNPCDFFPYSEDISSSAYNPTSNGCDILYTGIPEGTDGDPAYSARALAATIAHEYQHLARFAMKTYPYIRAGDPDPPYEDAAFDEAVSHFIENAIGLGLSGGNLRFVMRYLSSPAVYSLRGPDADGAMDSAGKRGLGALFIAYLCGLSGDIDWDSSSPGILVDDDGLDFIRQSMHASVDGWEYAASFFQKPLSMLWREFILSINKASFFAPDRVVEIDGATGEPFTLDPFIGVFSMGTIEASLLGPTRNNLDESLSLSGWTALFGTPAEFSQKTSIGVKYRPGSGENEAFMGMLHY